MTIKPITRLALTPGEPAGIGPDLCIRLAQENLPCQLVAVADPRLLLNRAEQLGVAIQLRTFDPGQSAEPQQAGHLCVMPVALKVEAVCGRLDSVNSAYVLETLDKAVQGCIEGWFDAMVTGPVHKGIINDAGCSFSGHTEYIAGITGGYPVMMLATPGLRVALVTTHLPLAEVCTAITAERLETVLGIVDQDLRRRFSIQRPKILVCGLNPHAGENGHLGQEELTVINPVLAMLRKRGLNLVGPLPADTAFTPKNLAEADVVVAMYHDQGLPVLKHKGFGEAVNVTLGLPVIRTSVDHGTALDLAGTGKADVGSLQFAVQTALDMVDGFESAL